MLLFLSLGLLAVSLAHLSFLKKNDMYLFFSFLVILVVMAFQDSVSADFKGYIETFEGIFDGKIRPALFRSQRDRLDSTEAGWYLLNYLIGSVIPSFHAVAFVALGFYCFTLSKIIHLVVPGTFRWLAIAYFYVNPMLFNMSGIRQTVAIGFFILAICELLDDRRWYMVVLWMLCGTLFHNSMLFSLPFLALVIFRKGKGYVPYVYMAVFAMLFMLAVFSGAKYQELLFEASYLFFSDNVDVYAHYLSDMDAMAYSLKSIIRLFYPFAFSLVVLPMANRKEFTFLVLFIIGQILYALFGFEGNMQRITLYCTAFALPSFMIIANHLKDYRLRFIFWSGTLALNAYFLMVMLKNAQYAKFMSFNLFFLNFS